MTPRSPMHSAEVSPSHTFSHQSGKDFRPIEYVYHIVIHIQP